MAAVTAVVNAEYQSFKLPKAAAYTASVMPVGRDVLAGVCSLP